MKCELRSRREVIGTVLHAMSFFAAFLWAFLPIVADITLVVLAPFYFVWLLDAGSSDATWLEYFVLVYMGVFVLRVVRYMLCKNTRFMLVDPDKAMRQQFKWDQQINRYMKGK